VLILGEMEPLSPKNPYRNYDPPNISKALGRISPFKPTTLAELTYERVHRNVREALLKLVTNFYSLLNARPTLGPTDYEASRTISY